MSYVINLVQQLVMQTVSRLPQPTPSEDVFPEPAGVHLLEARDLCLLSPRDIARATDSDVVLRQVKIYIHQRWSIIVPTELLPFYSKRAAFLLMPSECILWHERVAIPSALQETVENYSKTMARGIVWWPNINSDITNKVKLCKACQTVANALPRSVVCPWPQAERAWKRVYLDYAGPFLGHYLLIVIDAYSKWPIVKVMSSVMAAVIITHMRYISADLGKPLVIVTDNGWQFMLDEFSEFLQSNGICHLYTPPRHPSSNGLAEHTVQQLRNCC
ncbi:hypothetical protein PR048_020808 [Dryococelus australis]|uniref:RNA-directed DNA polymerase n=1 Tax=Dryococelus australis TaxID=614101 RepID=A0ABQ9GWF4_9NEOP|nr:hypothetical protein PR048_020808 [Dryococelus australis]